MNPVGGLAENMAKCQRIILAAVLFSVILCSVLLHAEGQSTSDANEAGWRHRFEHVALLLHEWKDPPEVRAAAEELVRIRK